jgi:hypothetical protein
MKVEIPLPTTCVLKKDIQPLRAFYRLPDEGLKMIIVRGSTGFTNDLGRRAAALRLMILTLLLTIGSCSASKWWSVPLDANTSLSSLFQERS